MNPDSYTRLPIITRVQHHRLPGSVTNDRADFSATATRFFPE
ncbi:hypothetical protein [Paraglaciecola sp. T6c]|nr:hypothetical protein [Paraglaciecola sp. T6c]